MRLQSRLLAYGVMCIGALTLAACSSTKELIVLLPEADGTVGKVAVVKGDDVVLLEKELEAARVTRQGRVGKHPVSQPEVDQTFAQALAAQPPASMSFRLYFEMGTSTVTEESRSQLEALLAEVATRAAVEVEITGHTDTVGKLEDNDRLSLARAQTVRDLLVQRGIHAHFIRTVGRGERELLVSTPEETAEPRNRRVEIIVR